jgi:hypothetical protein
MLFILLILAVAAFVIVDAVRSTTAGMAEPIYQFSTQAAELLHPTPTIKPDPVTIVHEVKALARLETIQYSVEKVITAEVGQGAFEWLFGDKLLFVAHGTVIAGVDLNKLRSEDITLEGDTLYISLPEAEVFVATLDNDKSYIYDRDTGLLRKSEKDLETAARQAAEDEILKAALEDGILDQAQTNAESYLYRLLHDLGFPDVVFLGPVPSSAGD